MNVKEVQKLFNNLSVTTEKEKEEAKIDFMGLIVDRLGELKAYSKCDDIIGLKEAKMIAFAEIIGSVMNIANIYDIDVEEALNYFKGC